MVAVFVHDVIEDERRFAFSIGGVVIADHLHRAGWKLMLKLHFKSLPLPIFDFLKPTCDHHKRNASSAHSPN